MRRTIYLAYGLACYSMFLGVFLYLIGFLGNFGVPRSIDAPAQDPLGVAISVNVLILAVFALQHSGMARPAFKRWWTQYVPKPLERSTYVLFSNLAMILFFWQWRPLGGTVWHLESLLGKSLMYGLFAVGWGTILASTLMINHFDLFGLRQVWLYFRGRPYTQLPFCTPGFYRYVRHPLYVGWLLAIWATPTMSPAHLMFALGTTIYILVAIQFEERDLVEHLPGYAEYRRRVAMLVPRIGV